MADTVASLTAEIARLEAAMERTLALGQSTSLPTGTTHAPHRLADLETVLRSRRARLARLQAVEAGRHPFEAAP